MIRINLLATEQRAGAKKKASRFNLAGQKMTIGCSIILVASVGLIGWRYWSLTRQAKQIDGEIAAAQRETTRLHGIIQQVQQFEQRKSQLQQRVVLIEQLRKEQKGPVHMLDEVSRSLPSMLWLNELKQTGNDVVIDGHSTTLTGLSDFVASLEATGYFKKSIEIVSTQAETVTQPAADLVKFSIRATFQTPGDAKAPASGGDAGRGAAPPAAADAAPKAGG